MTVRKYQSRSQKTALASPLAAGASTMTVNSGALLVVSTIPAGATFTVVIDPDTSLEEIVEVINWSSGNTLTINRGIDGSNDVGHSAGAVVRHMAIGRDYREANEHIENTTTAHGITLANVVKTTDTATVTSTMIVDGTILNADINASAAIADTKLATISTASKVSNSATTATALNTTGAIVARNGSGDFAAGTITANLTGNVTGNVTGDVTGTVSGNAGTVTNGVYTIDTGSVTSTMIANGTIVDADINSSAAITKTKISGTAITAADTGTVTSTMIANDTIVNTDINTSAQIAYGKLNLTNTIVNADIAAGAAIAMTKLAVDPTARTNHTGTQAASTISDLDATIKSYKVTDLTAPTTSVSVNSQKITNLATPTTTTDAATKAYVDLMVPLSTVGVADGVAPLDGTGKIPFDHMPASVIADTFVVSSQSAMLALGAGVGDIAVRTDLNKSFILQVTPATTLGNWIELLTPLDAVTSVDGLVGIVNLSSTYATVANAANKLPLAGGTMSGAIAMGTNKITGVGDPTNAQDVVTKYYLDNVVLAPSNLTGPITSVANLTSIASQTGTGTKFVVDTSPTLVTPNIGVATATSVNGTVIPTSKTLVATDSVTYVVPSQTGNSGKYLTTDGTTSSWGTVAGYSAPTLGSTSIASGATVTTISGLTDIVLNGAGSVQDELTLLLMGAL